MHKFIKLVVIPIVFFSSAYLTNAVAEVHEFTLENGLKVIMKENHRAPIVISQVWYKTGSSYEQEGKTGLAHVLEHMMFQGTKTVAAGEFSRIMSRHGASENAFTSYDYTAYFQTIAKQYLPLILRLEADRMQNLIVDEKRVKTELNVVLEERRVRTDDNPVSLLREAFHATAYQTSNYHSPIVGWKSDIENLKVDDIANWYNSWYAPNNAILVIIGDIDPEPTLELVKKYFSPLKSRVIPTPPYRPEVKQLGKKQLVVKRPAKSPMIMLGYKVPSLSTLPPEQYWEAYALDLLAYVLDGGDSARFSKNLIRGQQIISSINTSYDIIGRLEGLFTFSAIPANTKTIQEVEQGIITEINRVKTALVPLAELTRIKNKLKAETVYEQDSLFYQGMEIGMLETVGLSWKLAETYLDKIDQVTPEQIQQVAKKYLHEDSLTVGELQPQAINTTTTTGSVH